MQTKKIIASACATLALAAGGVYAVQAVANAASPTIDTYTLSFSGAGQAITHPGSPGVTSTEKSVFCNEGDYATGGGYDFSSYDTVGDYSVWRDRMENVSGAPGGWVVGVSTTDQSASVGSFTVYVICVDKLS